VLGSINSISANTTLTIDGVQPVISNITLRSSNVVTSTRAKSGDLITLGFTFSETVTDVTVADVGFTIANSVPSAYTNASTITLLGGNSYEAQILFTGSNTSSNSHYVWYSIDSSGIQDLAGNNFTGSGILSNTTPGGDFIIYDTVSPTLTFVDISSSSLINASKANDGDYISLRMTGDEWININTASVTIFNQQPTTINTTSPSSPLTDWEIITPIITSSDPSGTVTFSVEYYDMAGHEGSVNVNTTNGSSVYIDRTPPVISPIRMYSDNASTTLAKVGDTVYIEFTTNEVLSASNLNSIASGTSSTYSITGTDTIVYSYVMQSSDPEGFIAFSFNATDTALNDILNISSVTTGTAVYFDKTVPVISPIRMYSDNASTTLAKVGDTVYVEFVTNEDLSSFNLSSIASGTSSTYSLTGTDTIVYSYVMQSSDPEGFVAFSFNATDTALNDVLNISSVTTGTAVYFDNTSPTVTTVRTSSELGRYTDDDDSPINSDTISIQVNFDEIIYVSGGTPTLEMETGSIDRLASYSSGSGSNTLTFIYKVQDGDLTSPLNYTSTTALSDNGAFLKDTSGNFADLLLPETTDASSMQGATTIQIDAENPTFNFSSSTSNASSTSFVKDGELVSYTVIASEELDVSTLVATVTNFFTTKRFKFYS
jgi:hypothetical protein